MNIGQSLYQGNKLSQQLNLAPQLLNWLQLLQAPTQELSSMIQSELESNPALELADPMADASDFDTYDMRDVEQELQDADTRFDDGNVNDRLEALAEIDQDWRDDFSQNSPSCSKEEDEKHQYVLDTLVYGESIFTHLQKQLGLYDLSDEQIHLAEEIIGSLDDRGYLSTSLVELAENLNESLENMKEALTIVQQLEPAGIAARDLRDCLLLQVEDPDSITYRVLNECFDLLADCNIEIAAERLDVELEDIEDALAEIRTFSPEPGKKITSEPTTYVEPDVFIRKEDGEWRAEINDEEMPHLRISPACRALLEQKELSPTDMAFIRQKIRNGQFLIRGISQRKETLLRVAKEIMRVQREFFDVNGGEMAPLTMNKVAAIIGVHETTVSRAIANKYVQTPRGLMPMKSFFKSGYRCADGSALTPERVKDLIDDIIHTEEPSHPITDQHISEALKEKGLKVARRTVAKYREELDIPSSKERMRAFRLQQKMEVAKAVA